MRVCPLFGLVCALSAPAWAANPPLDCQSPKAPPDYAAFGVGRASLAQAGSEAAAMDAAAKASAADLVGRLCADGCQCQALAPLQPYSFGKAGDVLCHMTVVPTDAVLRFRQARDPAAAQQAVATALAEAWGRLGATGRPRVALAVGGASASWLRGQATAWLSARAEVGPAGDCKAALATPPALCLRLAEGAAGAAERTLEVEVQPTSGPRSAVAGRLNTCALQAASGALVCPDDGDPAGDHCEPRGGAIPACSARPMGGAGVWASAEAEGGDDDALDRARSEALRRVVAPIVGVSAAGGRDDALEARLRTATIADFTAFRCRVAPRRLRVDVFVPDRERQRLVRAQRNATLGVLVCGSTPAGACTDQWRDRVRALGSSAGLDLADVVASPSDPGSSEIRRLAAQADANTVLVVRLSAEYKGVQKPYHLCRAQVAATLWDAAAGKGTREAKPAGYGSEGGFKGVVLADTKPPQTPVQACQDALRNGWKELATAVALWAEGR
ncbi:MAG: hypothetical protein FJ100_21750 [Deltaproteobacteria bacterium]|nr:hypothetical protein [Deltaproteobacteria bacterium]